MIDDDDSVIFSARWHNCPQGGVGEHVEPRGHHVITTVVEPYLEISIWNKQYFLSTFLNIGKKSSHTWIVKIFELSKHKTVDKNDEN